MLLENILQICSESKVCDLAETLINNVSLFMLENVIMAALHPFQNLFDVTH